VPPACPPAGGLTPSRADVERARRLAEGGEDVVDVGVSVPGGKQRTGGFGVHAVLECVGTDASTRTSVEIARPRGAVGRVGVPHYPAIPQAQPMFYKNVTVGGGPAPVRAYIEALLPDILATAPRQGRISGARHGA
jgi:threonine dehydrogenase-like Zn-dependent dehydrogenase